MKPTRSDFAPGEPIYCINVSNVYITQGVIVKKHPEWENDWIVKCKTIWPFSEISKNTREEIYSDWWIFRNLKDALSQMQERKKLNDHQMLKLAFQKVFI